MRRWRLTTFLFVVLATLWVAMLVAMAMDPGDPAAFGVLGPSFRFVSWAVIGVLILGPLAIVWVIGRLLHSRWF